MLAFYIYPTDKKSRLVEKYEAALEHIGVLTEAEVAVQAITPEGKQVSNLDKKSQEKKLGYILGDIYLCLDFIDHSILKEKSAESSKKLFKELQKLITERNNEEGSLTTEEMQSLLAKFGKYSDPQTSSSVIIKDSKEIRKAISLLWAGELKKLYPEDDYEEVITSAAFWYDSYSQHFSLQQSSTKSTKFGNKTVDELRKDFDKRVAKKIKELMPQDSDKELADKQIEAYKKALTSIFEPFIKLEGKMLDHKVNKNFNNRIEVRLPISNKVNGIYILESPEYYLKDHSGGRAGVEINF